MWFILENKCLLGFLYIILMQAVKQIVEANKAIYASNLAEQNISKNGIVYYPFISEKETIDWIDSTVSQWWDDETI